MVVDLLDDRSRLPNAVAMNSLQFQLSRVVGPLLAGITLSAWGTFWCFFLNALSFLPLIWVLYTIKNRQVMIEAEEALLERFAAGFRYVVREQLILLVILIVAAACLFGYPYLNLMPVVARKLFTNDAQGLGYLMGGTGAGAMLAALALSVRMPSPRETLITILASLFAFGVALSTAGFAHGPKAAVGLFMICGFSMVTCTALCNTTIQRRVPDAMRGRVLAMFTFASYVFLPFGNLGGGILAEHRGIAVTLLVMGLALVISAVAGAAAAVASLRPRAAAEKVDEGRMRGPLIRASDE